MKLPEDFSNEFTLNANGWFLVFISIFWGLFFVLSIYAYSIKQLEIFIVILFLLFFLFSILISQRYKLTLNYKGFTFSRIIKERSLDWNDILSVSTVQNNHGSYGEPLMIFKSKDPLIPDIKFNYLYFQRATLHLLLQYILFHNSFVQFDKRTQEYLNRSTKAFNKKYIAV